MYETQYEALRSHMMGSTTGPRGIGLAAFLQSGAAGWLRVVGACASAVPSGAISASRLVSPADEEPPAMARRLMTGLMPSTSYTEAARLIASLVLSAHPGPGPGARRASQQGVSQ